MEKIIDRICENCGKSFSVIPSRLKHGRGKNCSPKCQYASKAKKPRLSISRVCLGCGKPFLIHPSRLKNRNGAGKYCNRECRDAHRVKENHPQYLNGSSQEKRGTNWQSQRRKALKRDSYTCQVCGAFGEDVHHIIPFREFGLERFLDANKLDNLTTLCHVCHRKADTEIQRKDRALL